MAAVGVARWAGPSRPPPAPGTRSAGTGPANAAQRASAPMRSTGVDAATTDCGRAPSNTTAPAVTAPRATTTEAASPVATLARGGSGKPATLPDGHLEELGAERGDDDRDAHEEQVQGQALDAEGDGHEDDERPVPEVERVRDAPQPARHGRGEEPRGSSGWSAAAQDDERRPQHGKQCGSPRVRASSAR